MCRHRLLAWLGAALMLSSGCSEKPQSREGEPTQADRDRFRGYHSSAAALPPTAIKAATGDFDHDFLRLMSDHHKDLIRITHAVLESNSSTSLEPAVRKFEEDHDRELDAMLALLGTIYKDSYVPQTNPGNDFIVEMLRKPGTDYAGIFLASALNSERNSVQILNAYLKGAKNQQVRRFAQKMSSEEGGEMADLRSALNNR